MAKIWYVEFPTYQYNEDVVELARKNDLKIIDAKFDKGDGAKDVPKLSKIGEEKQARKPKEVKTEGE